MWWQGALYLGVACPLQACPVSSRGRCCTRYPQQYDILTFESVAGGIGLATLSATGVGVGGMVAAKVLETSGGI